MSKTSRIIYFIIAIALFILFDNYLTNIALDSILTFKENPIFDLFFVKNTGAAFNIFEGAKLFLIIFSVIALLSVVIYTLKNISKLSMITIFSSSILCSGIFCNMLERIMFGYVRDFIKLNFIDFPVFNISDIYINISVFVILVIVIKNTYLKHNENNN